MSACCFNCKYGHFMQPEPHSRKLYKKPHYVGTCIKKKCKTLQQSRCTMFVDKDEAAIDE